MRTLTRYIGRDVLASTLLIFGALLGLFTFFDLINEMRDVGRGSYTLGTALMYVAPPAERLAQTVRAAAMGNATGVVAQQFESGFWFKQDRTFVNIRTVMADMTLVGVRMYEFDKDLRLTAIRSAESARYAGDGQWKLRKVQVTDIGRDVAKVSTQDEWTWASVLQPSILTVYQVAPERLALSTLWDNIQVLGNGAQRTSRFEIAFWSKVLYPVAVIVMIKLALPFAQFQRRQGGVGFRIFAGTMLGLAFWLIERLFSYLGVLNDWAPLFAAAFPLVAFALLAMAMQYYIERR